MNVNDDVVALAAAAAATAAVISRSGRCRCVIRRDKFVNTATGRGFISIFQTPCLNFHQIR
eukprot:1185476-Prorocentrum_minimum.AAC.6